MLAEAQRALHLWGLRPSYSYEMTQNPHLCMKALLTVCNSHLDTSRSLLDILGSERHTYTSDQVHGMIASLLKKFSVHILQTYNSIMQESDSQPLSLMLLGSDTIGKILMLVGSDMLEIVRRTCKSLRKQSEGILERFVSLSSSVGCESLTLSNSKVFKLYHHQDSFPSVRYSRSEFLQIEPCCPNHSFSCLIEAMKIPRITKFSLNLSEHGACIDRSVHVFRWLSDILHKHSIVCTYRSYL
jgi:hypothetical protein